jgi:primary-amine oxidase
VHRASLVEMAVPYGDPNPPFERKCAFDGRGLLLAYKSSTLFYLSCFKHSSQLL